MGRTSYICSKEMYKLSLNTQKTFYLVFHRAKIKDHDISIRIDGSTLNRSRNIKYIGVIIDHKLNWCEHIAHVKNMVSNGIGILYKAKQFPDKKSLHNLYYSYIYPYLIYIVLRSVALHVRRIYTPYF